MSIISTIFRTLIPGAVLGQTKGTSETDKKTETQKKDEVVLNDDYKSNLTPKERLSESIGKIEKIDSENEKINLESRVDILKKLSETWTGSPENRREIYKLAAELDGIAILEPKLKGMVTELKNTSLGTRYYLSVIDDIKPIFEKVNSNNLGLVAQDLIQFGALMDEGKVPEDTAKAKYLESISNLKVLMSEEKFKGSTDNLGRLANKLISDFKKLYPNDANFKALVKIRDSNPALKKAITDEDLKSILTEVKVNPPVKLRLISEENFKAVDDSSLALQSLLKSNPELKASHGEISTNLKNLVPSFLKSVTKENVAELEKIVTTLNKIEKSDKSYEKDLSKIKDSLSKTLEKLKSEE